MVEGSDKPPSNMACAYTVIIIHVSLSRDARMVRHVHELALPDCVGARVIRHGCGTGRLKSRRFPVVEETQFVELNSREAKRRGDVSFVRLPDRRSDQLCRAALKIPIFLSPLSISFSFPRQGTREIIISCRGLTIYFAHRGTG